MRIRGTVLALSLGAAIAGVGCETVKKTTNATEQFVTGDVHKIYAKQFDDVVAGVKQTAADLEVVKVNEDSSLTKDAKKRYTLTTRTKEDKKLIFVVIREDDARTSASVDTSGFTGSGFRNKVVSALEARLGK